MKIPAHGSSAQTLFEQLHRYRAHDLDTHGGRTWAYVYDSGVEGVREIAAKAYTHFLSENALDPTAFPSLLRLENEIVAMAAAHLGGDANVVGNFTSGGTESCMLAVKTARDFARTARHDVAVPEIILPVTAHAAFHKAAHYLGVRAVVVDVDPLTYRADIDRVQEAITANTVLIVGSAVSYAHGVVDPIEALGMLAMKHGLLLHVDGCIGGFILPYFKRLGAPVPTFDFSVPGVTSISMDFHKYAYCPKGASVVLYRNKELRRHQIYACAGWSGYTIVNPTIQSTRSGGPLAATWAVLHYLGDEGYLSIARKTLDATRSLVAGLSRIPGLRILGTPDSSLIAFTSDDVDVFHLADEMRLRDWYVQPQLGFGSSPANIHLSVTGVSLSRVAQLLGDLEASVEAARALGPAVPEALREALPVLMAESLSDPGALPRLLETVGAPGGVLPERVALINGVMNLLPVEARESLLTAFMNEIYTPPSDAETA